MEGRKCKTAGQLRTFCWEIEVLVQKLNHDTELLRKFDEVIQNQLKSGMIEMVTENTGEGERRHYIPHHAAIKLDINTIKVNVVDDALAKSKKLNLSLNECLHRVSIILENICGLLMRFRTRGIGIVADIENAFFQIGPQPKEKGMSHDFYGSKTQRNLQHLTKFFSIASQEYHLESYRVHFYWELQSSII